MGLTLTARWRSEVEGEGEALLFVGSIAGSAVGSVRLLVDEVQRELGEERGVAVDAVAPRTGGQLLEQRVGVLGICAYEGIHLTLDGVEVGRLEECVYGVEDMTGNLILAESGRASLSEQADNLFVVFHYDLFVGVDKKPFRGTEPGKQ